MASIISPQKRADLFIIRGDTVSLPFTVDMDLTDCTVYFTAKSTISNSADDSDAVMSVTVTDHNDPTNGVTTIPLTSTTTNVTPGTYYYDIQIKDGDGNITSIPVRKLEVAGDITRRTS